MESEARQSMPPAYNLHALCHAIKKAQGVETYAPALLATDVGVAACHQHADDQFLVDVHQVGLGVAPNRATPLRYCSVGTLDDLGVHAPDTAVRLLVVRIARRPIANQLIGTSQAAKARNVGLDRRHAGSLRNDITRQHASFFKELLELVKQFLAAAAIGAPARMSRANPVQATTACHSNAGRSAGP